MNLWLETLDAPLQHRAGITDDLDVDIAIVGGGFTGLWAAHFLRQEMPGAKIVVLEKEFVGFGASGRNGGWASALYPVAFDRLVTEVGEERARNVREVWRRSVPELGAELARHGIDAGYSYGGNITVARTKVQMKRVEAEFMAAEHAGEGAVRLSRDQVKDRINISGAVGGLFIRECARIHPAKAVRGLASAVERAGVKIYEESEVLSLRPGASSVAKKGIVKVRHLGTIRRVHATHIVEATEGFLPSINSPTRSNRSVVPVYSLMTATEPLSPEIWKEIGWSGNETLAEASHLITYAQRTADDRIAIGGRGAPYFFNSKISPEQDRDPQVHGQLRELARSWFPILRDVNFTHAWGGPLGIARDWHPTVSYNETNGYARAGGYVGDGVTSSYVAGRTLADLLSGKKSEFTKLPWVNHQSPPWEGEPVRWLAINAGLKAMTWADREEHLTHRESLIARAMASLLGH